MPVAHGMKEDGLDSVVQDQEHFFKVTHFIQRHKVSSTLQHLRKGSVAHKSLLIKHVGLKKCYQAAAPDFGWWHSD